MANQLFGVNIPAIMNAAAGNISLDLILIKVTEGARTPGALSAGRALTTNTYKGKGFSDNSLASRKQDTLVQQGVDRIMIFADSIQSNKVPEIGDKITIESVTYVISDVGTDAAKAIYVCPVEKE